MRATIFLLPENTPKCIQNFVGYFENLKDSKHSISLSSFYDDSIEFKDPIHQIQSISSVTSYFDKLNKNLKSGGFTFTSISINEKKCYLEWNMEIELNRPNKIVSASGISVLSFEHKITHHRDYFDAGEVFYENVPLLGSVIKRLKKSLKNN